jgi:transglutaminase-like putative cysteine protease
VTAALLIALAGEVRAGTPPDWVHAAISAAPAAPAAAAHVLLDDVAVTVSADGRMRTSRRYVVRVNDRAARDAAILREVYLEGSDVVRAMRGWLVRRGGETRELGERDTVDVAYVNAALYNEVRARVIRAEDARDGDVFAAESESDEGFLFSQLHWPLQDRWPVNVVRRRLALPAGWRPQAVMFNGPPMEPRQEDGRWTWEGRQLPEIPDEPGGAPLTDLAPRLAVSFFAPDVAPARGQFTTWPEVSRWLQRVSDGGGPSPAVTARARELTASATTNLERVQAIAAFVQRIQYVSIQTGVARGGGYQPRAGALVLERNYGDCKDKSGLMRQLLASLGIQSYLVSVFAGDANYVRREWPTPKQFNHVIVAVSVEEAPERSTSVVTDPVLGRLLLFDPTDEHTRLGDLPVHEQGGLALILSDPGSDLVRVPVAPAQRLERSVAGVLDVSGGFTGTVRERFSGGLAAVERMLRGSLQAEAYRAAIARRLSALIPRTAPNSVQVKAEDRRDSFDLTIDLAAPGFAQRQGPLLLVVPPVSPEGVLKLTAAESRRTPLRLRPMAVEERIELRVPEGVSIDEMPNDVELEFACGVYSLSYAQVGDRLVIRRHLELTLPSLQPGDYAYAKDFFDRVRVADAAPIVLIGVDRAAAIR